MPLRRRERKPPAARAAVPACDGWTRLNSDQLYLGYRFLEIMQQMNRASYSPTRPERMVARISGPPSEYFLFSGARFEIALGFRWIAKLNRFRIMSVGFIGQITPLEALNRVTAKCRSFATSKGVTRLIAVRPFQMENPCIMQFYGLLKGHATIQVRGGHRLPEGEYLWIDFPPLS